VALVGCLGWTLAVFTEQVEAENVPRRMLALVWPEEVEGLVPALPRALRALANEAVATRDGPHPLAELEPSPPGASIVVRAGRATRVP
jgi:hypothetical protein